MTQLDLTNMEAQANLDFETFKTLAGQGSNRARIYYAAMSQAANDKRTYRYVWKINRMKKLLMIICVLGLFGPVAAVAEEKSEWLADKNRLEKLVEENKCSEYWDVLWPWAKNGNLEARTWLFILMAPPPGMDTVFAPGNSDDFVTKTRNIVIMAAHSHDYKGKLELRKEYGNTAQELFKMVGFDQSLKGREFLKCTKDNVSKNCAEIAVKAKLIPSFENFALQIDTFIKNGMESKCTHRGNK